MNAETMVEKMTNEDLYSEDDIIDAMTRATKNAKITKDDLICTYKLQGLIGVYNLGLKNMYGYLSDLYKES